MVALGVIDPWLAAAFHRRAADAPAALLARDTSTCVADYQQVQGRIASALAEAVGGTRTIRAAGTADRDAERILRPLPELSRAGRRMWRVQGRAAARAVAVAPLLHLAVVAVAGMLLSRHRLSAGDVLAASATRSSPPGSACWSGSSPAWSAPRRRPAAWARSWRNPPYARGPEPAARRPRPLELRGVSARRGARTVLDGVDLVVPGGTTLALVGRSGAGKSLLAALVVGSPTRTPARCCWTASRCPPSPAPNCARRSRTPSTAPPFWARLSRTRSPWGCAALLPPASGRPLARPAPTRSSAACPTAMRRRRRRPALGGEAQRLASPGRSPSAVVCSSSTTRSPALTR
ncbi:hypothetical protein O1M63_47270 [Streptomyces mirabilis]|nr:hypothetical protein [Streptomyces mirabilis]